VILEAQCRWLPEKKQKMEEQRGTGEDEEAKEGAPTSKAARKTTVRRDGGEILSY